MQAKWEEENGQWKEATHLYLKAGDVHAAVDVICTTRRMGWQETLMSIIRGMKVTDRKLLLQCVNVLHETGEDILLEEVYKNMSDFTSLVKLYIRKQDWSSVEELSAEHPKAFDADVLLPYANWLSANDQFDKAINFYSQAGRADLSIRTLHKLAYNASTLQRYKNAAYFLRLGAKESFFVTRKEGNGHDEKAWIDSQQKCYDEMMIHSDIYYAYSFVHSFTIDPFTNMQPETLFQVSCFLLNVLNGSEPPRGISRVHILYTLAKQAKDLGVHQLAKEVYKDLQQLNFIPPCWRDKIELDMLSLNKSHLKNKQELAPVYYLCRNTNHYLNCSLTMTHHQYGDACKFCGQRFIRSFLNFEVLPLVEFQPEANICDEDALTMIRSSSKSSFLMGTNKQIGKETGWRDKEEHKVNSENNSSSSIIRNYQEEKDDSGFVTRINETLEEVTHEAHKRKTISRVVIGEHILLRIRRQEVFYLPPPDHNSIRSRGRFFKNMMPDVPLAVSQRCRRFFHEDDLEYSYVSEGKTPISRIPDLGDYGTI